MSNRCYKNSSWLLLNSGTKIISYNLISSIETLYLMFRYIVLVSVVWTIQSIQHWKLIVMLNWHFQQTFDFCFVLLKLTSSLTAPRTKLTLLSHHFSRLAPLKLMQQDYGSVPSVNIMFCKITNSRANTGREPRKIQQRVKIFVL